MCHILKVDTLHTFLICISLVHFLEVWTKLKISSEIFLPLQVTGTFQNSTTVCVLNARVLHFFAECSLLGP